MTVYSFAWQRRFVVNTHGKTCVLSCVPRDILDHKAYKRTSADSRAVTMVRDYL